MFSHIKKNNQPGMVDVSEKNITHRVAKASALVKLPEEIKTVVKDGEIESKKGPVLTTAIIAGTQAVKKTHELIPFCHPLSINGCDISIVFNKDSDLVITCIVNIDGKTGVEMEALTGVSVASLTIYDMCKSISHGIVISDIRLLEKSGGKSDIS
jgi:cyclic pyranopterin monophosphate synthase